jgi:hypothetical protein
MTRRQALLVFAALPAGAAVETRDRLSLIRVPAGGLQPQSAVDNEGVLHLVYYLGDAGHGDLFYVQSKDAGRSFSSPIRVNSQEGSAIAAGTIRGAQVALGRDRRVHVAWNGSNRALPKGPVNPDSGQPGEPMLYSRLDDSGRAFEPQRNVMQRSFGLDGGGSIAAAPDGNVYVAWHGIGESEAKSGEGEGRRRVWIAKSDDGGRTFSHEDPLWQQKTGACGCCGMKIHAAPGGTVAALYRSATETVHRDIYALTSHDRAGSFSGHLLDRWEIGACPMSSMDIVQRGDALLAAWETAGQVYWGRLDGTSGRTAAPGEGKGRKHPRLAVNRRGEILFVWTEGTGWNKGGTLAWQMYDSAGQPAGPRQESPGISTWSFASPIAVNDGRFAILF